MGHYTKLLPFLVCYTFDTRGIFITRDPGKWHVWVREDKESCLADGREAVSGEGSWRCDNEDVMKMMQVNVRHWRQFT